MRNHRLLFAAVAVILSAPATADTSGNICIDGRFLVSGETRQIEIYDNNGNRGAGTHAMHGGQVTSGPDVVVNGSGYINVKYRNVTNNGSWIDDSMKKSGDCIKP